MYMTSSYRILQVERFVAINIQRGHLERLEQKNIRVKTIAL